MQALSSDRRAFVAGGAAVGAGLALAGWAGLSGDEAAPGVNGVQVAPGTSSATVAAVPASDAGDWQAMVGETLSFAAAGTGTGFVATVTAVESLPARGKLPAGVRARPFVVRLRGDRAAAPAVDGLFSLNRPIDGLSQVFVQRRQDRGGLASLTAIFN